MKSQRKRKKSHNIYLRFSALAIQMAVVILLGVYFGDFLDSYTNQKRNLFTVIFSLLGIATSFYFVFKKLKND